MNIPHISDLLLRIDLKEEKQNLDEKVQEFERKISSINDSIEDEGFGVLFTGSSKNWEERKKRSELHFERTKESLAIFCAFYSGNDENRMDNILKLVKKSCELIDKEDNAFYELNHRWKEMNQLMIQKSNQIKRLEVGFEEKGIKIIRTDFSSLYLFLQCNDIDRLDSLWSEYSTGQLLDEMRKHFGDYSYIRITINEDNYKMYRKFLRKYSWFLIHFLYFVTKMSYCKGAWLP